MLTRNLLETLRSGESKNGAVLNPTECAIVLASLADTLTCDMDHDCAEPITHIDEKGFIYCAAHGKERREYGRRCRRMTGPELKQIRAGQPLARY